MFNIVSLQFVLESDSWYKNNADFCHKETNWATGQVSVALNVPVWQTDEGMY